MKISVQQVIDCSGTGPLKISGPKEIAPKICEDGSKKLELSLEQVMELLYNGNYRT